MFGSFWSILNLFLVHLNIYIYMYIWRPINVHTYYQADERYNFVVAAFEFGFYFLVCRFVVEQWKAKKFVQHQQEEKY